MLPQWITKWFRKYGVDTRVSQLPSAASLASTDELYAITTPGTTPTSKNVTFAVLVASLAALAAIAFPAGSTIGGKQVCLADGTNCPASSGAIPTLLQVTNAGGASTSTSVYFYGGTTSSNLTATGTTALQGVSFTYGTGTSIQTTSGTINYLSFNGATGSTLYASTYVSSSAMYANSANITTLTGTSSTHTYISFNGATGSTLYLSGYVSSSAIYANAGTFGTITVGGLSVSQTVQIVRLLLSRKLHQGRSQQKE